MGRKGRFGLVQPSALTVALALGLVLICGPPLSAKSFDAFDSVEVEQDLGSLGGPPEAQDFLEDENVGIDDPDAISFCMLDPCPGQTCDEVNNRCVGNVTLQPRMGQPLNALSKKLSGRFDLGKTAFERTFTVPDGLGPTFNQDSCASCHNTPVGGSGTITVTRFGFIDASTFPFTFDPLGHLGGSLLQAQSIGPGCQENIPVPPTNVAANRVTNSALGFGLLEAIPDADIEANAITPPPGVSGRVHVVPVLENPPQTKVGRFGWKSQLATVLSFSADAALMEMGITNRILPQEEAANNDPAKVALCDTVPDPEDGPDQAGKHFIDRVTDFQRLLAPPPQTPRSGMRGEEVFVAIGCANCHVRTFTTADDESLEDPLQGQEIHPYSDFLLHDVGYNGDFIGQGDAGITELRTPPLWGMRVRDPLWHDGRVAGGTFDFRVQLVIDQHSASDGEAFASAMAYTALPTVDKNALVAFLDSLGKAEFDMDGDGLITATDQLAVEVCAGGPQNYDPDHPCAVADTDQDGDVDTHDLDLLDVALGVVIPDDEGDDEGGDDEGGDGGSGGSGTGPAVGDQQPNGAATELDAENGKPGVKDLGEKALQNETTDEGKAEASTERRPRLDRQKRDRTAGLGR